MMMVYIENNVVQKNIVYRNFAITTRKGTIVNFRASTDTSFSAVLIRSRKLAASEKKQILLLIQIEPSIAMDRIWPFCRQLGIIRL